jgi:hypothetical protein
MMTLSQVSHGTLQALMMLRRGINATVSRWTTDVTATYTTTVSTIRLSLGTNNRRYLVILPSYYS